MAALQVEGVAVVSDQIFLDVKGPLLDIEHAVVVVNEVFFTFKVSLGNQEILVGGHEGLPQIGEAAVQDPDMAQVLVNETVMTCELTLADHRRSVVLTNQAFHVQSAGSNLHVAPVAVNQAVIVGEGSPVDDNPAAHGRLDDQTPMVVMDQTELAARLQLGIDQGQTGSLCYVAKQGKKIGQVLGFIGGGQLIARKIQDYLIIDPQTSQGIKVVSNGVQQTDGRAMAGSAEGRFQVFGRLDQDDPSIGPGIRRQNRKKSHGHDQCQNQAGNPFCLVSQPLHTCLLSFLHCMYKPTLRILMQVGRPELPENRFLVTGRLQLE